MAKHSIILALFIAAFFSCKRKNEKVSSLSVKEIAREISATNVLTSDQVGDALARPRQWDLYEDLRSKATDKELLLLTTDKNSVVRCYSFQALAARKSTELFGILINHLSDTAKVTLFSGCLIDNKKSRRLFLRDIYKL